MAEQPCPHVTPAMIAAGFTSCATCGTADGTPGDPAGRVTAAYEELGIALMSLANEAIKASKACQRKRPNPDLDRVRAGIRDLDLAEQTVDTAVYDLATANGEHG